MSSRGSSLLGFLLSVFYSSIDCFFLFFHWLRRSAVSPLWRPYHHWSLYSSCRWLAFAPAVAAASLSLASQRSNQGREWWFLICNHARHRTERETCFRVYRQAKVKDRSTHPGCFMFCCCCLCFCVVVVSFSSFPAMPRFSIVSCWSILLSLFNWTFFSLFFCCHSIILSIYISIIQFNSETNVFLFCFVLLQQSVSELQVPTGGSRRSGSTVRSIRTVRQWSVQRYSWIDDVFG